MGLRLGCIADDITGGTDLALALSANGLKVVQLLGNADDRAPDSDVDVVVISLKVRTAPIDDAVKAALKACSTLQKWGAEQIYFKYCSTFDSTHKGNIGPIAEALTNHLKARVIPFVPSFPQNGRTVHHGHLYVNGELLSESSMKDHPLTPMTESNLCIHLGAQVESSHVGLIPIETIENGPHAIGFAMQQDLDPSPAFLIMDSVTDAHLAILAKACADLPLLTGGSAFADALSANFDLTSHREDRAAWQPTHNGPIAILSGSCSAASLEQVNRAAKSIPILRLDMTSNLTEFIDVAKRKLNAGAVIISSTATPDQIARAQAEYGKDIAGDRIEQMFGTIALALHDAGIRTFIIGGGETSGAVAAALSLTSLEVGPEIAPGVPWMRDTESCDINITFKSGNFGGADFFLDAINSLTPARS